MGMATDIDNACMCGLRKQLKVGFDFSASAFCK